MALDNWTNVGLSSLASALTSGATSLVVVTDTGSRFPTQDFQLILWDPGTFANPIDDPGREIVRCTARSGDVLTVLRGQEDTIAVAHAEGAGVALILTKKFRDDIQDALNTIGGEGRMRFFDDFPADVDSGVGNGSGATRRGAATWTVTGAAISALAAGGVWAIRGDGTFVGSLHAPEPIGRLVDLTLDQDITFRIRRIGTTSQTVRVGVRFDAGSVDFSADVADGLYLRFNNASGNFIAVARTSSTESTLDTGVAVDGNWHTFRFRVSALGTNAEVFVDGVAKGALSSNIPAGTLLGPAGGNSSATLAVGFEIDFIEITQDREL